MNRRALAITLLLIGGFAVPDGTAQRVLRAGSGGSGDVVVMREIGIVAGAREGSEEIQVLVLLPDGEPEVTIQQGDLVQMVNGKRVRELADLRQAYEGAAVGDRVKLGLRRGDQRFLASFEKQDPGEGAVRMVMVGGPGHDGDLQPLHEFGVILAEREDEVVVSVRLPMDEAAFDEDDVVASVNGREVHSLEEFRAIYEPLNIGDAISIVALRAGRELRETREKAASEGRIRMRVGP